jgi:hypothetical protein
MIPAPANSGFGEAEPQRQVSGLPNSASMLSKENSNCALCGAQTHN